MKVTCDVKELSATLDQMFELGRQKERERINGLLNSLIQPGKLQGDGTDKTAERNGIILALNTIHEMGNCNETTGRDDLRRTGELSGLGGG